MPTYCAIRSATLAPFPLSPAGAAASAPPATTRNVIAAVTSSRTLRPLEVYSVHDQQNYSSENEDDADEQRGFEEHRLNEFMCKDPDNGCCQECNQNAANPRTLQFGQGTCREH
ncbi:hypothetical protein SAMN05216228_1013114 [Rhizobium tibeticum]|uniref:Uncharacterized protein n=1 Tax=Rhizobium tibeticum TaxID=501024 RepID=A0A1H8MXJ2_9HYPH|nr:hypothetical protein RTCCBAU85039_4432 [Rhizobium tibeticum]SEO21989.1 hypothetical protein SAMN05216228_1013114 [Rhizobium tibeticum]